MRPYAEIICDLRDRAGKYDEYDWHSSVELEAAECINELLLEVLDLRFGLAGAAATDWINKRLYEPKER